MYRLQALMPSICLDSRRRTGLSTIRKNYHAKFSEPFISRLIQQLLLIRSASLLSIDYHLKRLNVSWTSHYLHLSSITKFLIDCLTTKIRLYFSESSDSLKKQAANPDGIERSWTEYRLLVTKYFTETPHHPSVHYSFPTHKPHIRYT